MGKVDFTAGVGNFSNIYAEYQYKMEKSQMKSTLPIAVLKYGGRKSANPLIRIRFALNCRVDTYYCKSELSE